jgi:hypothetical protein
VREPGNWNTLPDPRHSAAITMTSSKFRRPASFKIEAGALSATLRSADAGVRVNLGAPDSLEGLSDYGIGSTAFPHYCFRSGPEIWRLGKCCRSTWQ